MKEKLNETDINEEFGLATRFMQAKFLNFRFVPLHYQPSSLSDSNSSTSISSVAAIYHPFPLILHRLLLLHRRLLYPTFMSSRLYSWRFALQGQQTSPSIKNKPRPRLFEIVLTVASTPPPPGGGDLSKRVQIREFIRRTFHTFLFPLVTERHQHYQQNWTLGSNVPTYMSIEISSPPQQGNLCKFSSNLHLKGKGMQFNYNYLLSLQLCNKKYF